MLFKSLQKYLNDNGVYDIDGKLCTSSNSDGEFITKWEFYIEQPDLEEVVAEYKAHLNSIDYRDLRADEYPPIEDQLDAIWKSLANINSEGAVGIEGLEMLEKVMEVKYKYPKD